MIYALIDPGEPTSQLEDGSFDGIPFYVRQSCGIENRIRRHFRKSLKLNSDTQMVHRHIAGLFAISRLPRLAILDTAQTRSQSLMAELRWGQRLMRAGYQLTNTSPDIGRIMDDGELEAWLDFRRCSMLASEAAHEGAIIVHKCKCGHADRWVDPADFVKGWPKRLRVSQIANRTKECPSCRQVCDWWLDDRRLVAIQSMDQSVRQS